MSIGFSASSTAAEAQFHFACPLEHIAPCAAAMFIRSKCSSVTFWPCISPRTRSPSHPLLVKFFPMFSNLETPMREGVIIGQAQLILRMRMKAHRRPS